MITVQQLTYTYTKASSPAIRQLDFTVQAGEVFGFLGPSGAGKSTTQKILTGLLNKYEGYVAVHGRDMRQWGSDYYEQIGVSFELPYHYLKLTARENLRRFSALYQKETLAPETVLAWVGLREEADTAVGQFSKGMKNRLSLARALLHQPDLLFLDEPTAGLDPVNVQAIIQLVRQQQAAGRTIFLTTHDMHVANELCDRVAFIVAGKIVLIDTPRALRLRYGRAMVQVEHRQNGHTTVTEFELDHLQHNAQFQAILPHIETIHSQEATLADVFVAATGHVL